MSSSPSTRERILVAAKELFGAQGYGATSMRELAERLGVQKASLYHHFRSKAEILDSLLAPLLDQLDAVLEEAARDDELRKARRRFLEGTVDVMLAHRDVLALLFHDPSVYAEDTLRLAERLTTWVSDATELFTGTKASWRERLRVAQAVAALTDPIPTFERVPRDELRAELLHGAGRLLGLRYPGTKG